MNCDKFVKRIGRFFYMEPETKSPKFEDDNLSILADGIESFEFENFMELTEVTYSECESMDQVIESCEELKNTEKVLLLTVQLDDNFGSIDVQNLVQNCKRNSIVIFLESKTGGKFLILWKSKDVDSFYIFRHYSMAFDEADRQIYKFIADFLAKSLTRRHLGINAACLKDKNVKTILLSDLIDHRGFSLLLIALEQNKTELAKIMLSLGARLRSLDGRITAQSLAWRARNSEMILLMVKSNLQYPDGIDPSELSEEFQTFYEETAQLHVAIKARDSKKVDKILKSSQHKLRHFFDQSNKSAARVAIEQGSIDIYEILLRNNVFLAEDDILAGLSEDSQITIRELHTKYKKDSEDQHINILMARSHAAHDAMDAQDNMKHVRAAYELLAQNPLINIIFKVVTTARRFDIIYDFSRDSTNVVDPTTDESMKGVFYQRGQVFIGAKQLLEGNRKNETISVIAHEMCHFACDIMYRNDSNPFAKGDKNARKLFEEISQKCKASKDKEEIVNRVYECYKSNDVLAELIVRVPQMLAFYFDQPEKQRQCRESFPDLFYFYENRLVPEMENAIPEIEARVEREIEEKDEKILKYKKLLFALVFLSVVGVILTSYFFYKPTYTYDTLDPVDQQTVRNGSIFYKGVKLKLYDLFGNDSPAYQNLTSEHINQIFDEIPLNFSSPHLVYLDSQVYHNWQNMSEKLKEKVLNSNFTFQNESMVLARMADLAPNAFKTLTSGEIHELLNRTLAIGMMIPNKTKFFVERTLFLSKLFSPTDLNATIDDIENFNENESTREEIENRVKEKLFSSNLITKDTELKVTTTYCDRFDTSRGKNCFRVYIFYDMNEIIRTTHLSRLFILSDEAGMGKSVLFEQIAMEYKNRFPDHWVSYLDIKDYTRFYDKKRILDDPLDVLKEILDLKSKSQFELVIFEELFKTGKVVLLWDGFDEISPTFSHQVIDLIKFVYENSSNVQLFSTRPIYGYFLEQAFNITSGRLISYTKTKREEFLRKYFISEKVNDNEIADLITKVQNISARLLYKTPLMLTLIAEAHEELTNIESLNFYKIYETFVEKKIRIWREKSESNRKMSDKFIAKGFNVIKIYQKYAILREIKLCNIPRLKILQTKIPKGLTNDEISRMGILYINTEDSFQFSHKTFGEFFVAQFLIDNFLKLGNHEFFDEIVLDFFYVYAEMSEIIKSFFYAYIKDQKFDGNEDFHPEIEKLLRRKHRYFLFSILAAATLKPDLDTFRMFLLILSKDHKLLVDMLHVNADETLYTSLFNPSIMRYFTYAYDKFYSEEVENATAKLLTDDEFSRFLTGKHQKGIILFDLAKGILQHNPKQHQYYSLGDVNVTKDYVQNFYENIKTNLTEMERKNLLVEILSYPSDYHKGVFYPGSFLPDQYEKLWRENENLLGKKYTSVIIASILDSDYPNINGYPELLDFLLDKIQAILSGDEIFELFKTNQLCLKSLLFGSSDKIKYFEKIWGFLASHTTKVQQESIILQEYKFSGKEMLRYGDFTLFAHKCKIKLFHLIFFVKFWTEFDFPITDYFSVTEIREIILSSNDFMLIVITYKNYYFLKLLGLLREIFVGHEESLIEFLKRKIMGTDYTIFTYLDITSNAVSDHSGGNMDNIKENIQAINYLIFNLLIDKSEVKFK